MIEATKILTIRSCEPLDIAAIHSIGQETGLSSWTAEQYAKELERTDSICLVAVSEDQSVIGFVVGRIVPGIRNGRSFDAEIHNIGVCGSARKSGVGSALIERFLDHSRKNQVNAVWLEVRSQNKPAIKFYEKHGFTARFIRKGYYRCPDDDANVMYLMI